MDTVQYLLTGFSIAMNPATLFYCFIGVLWGTIVGILPGLGPLGGWPFCCPHVQAGFGFSHCSPHGDFLWGDVWRNYHLGPYEYTR